MPATSKARIEKLERQVEKQGWIETLRDLPRVTAYELGDYLNTLRSWCKEPPAAVNVESLSRTDTDWGTLTELIDLMTPGAHPAAVRLAVRTCQEMGKLSKEQCKYILGHHGKIPEEIAPIFREIEEEYEKAIRSESKNHDDYESKTTGPIQARY